MNVKKKAEKYITPLHMNKMHGRMMRMPAKSRNKEILLVYGHHSSIERVFGFAEYLNKYGAVTVPDLPGFGGMQSFYKIGREPTIDAMADYLASFIKMQYKRRRLTIIGMSFSVPVITRMLQKYPSVAKKVDIFMSYSGFVHKDDFSIARKYYWSLYILSTILSWRLVAALVDMLFMTKRFLNFALDLAMKFSRYTISEKERYQRGDIREFELELWQINDFRTRVKTLKEMLTLDLCNKQVSMPIHQIASNVDIYFDYVVVEQHMRIIFSDFEQIDVDIGGHSPMLIMNGKEVAKMVPNRVKQLLRS